MQNEEGIIVACTLRGTLENSDLTYNDIEKTFDEEVAEIVYALTDELGRNRKERKLKTYSKITDNGKATAVKLCDRIANVSQSKQHNIQLFKVNQNELSNFKNQIFNEKYPSLELKKAWNRLGNDLSEAKPYST